MSAYIPTITVGRDDRLSAVEILPNILGFNNDDETANLAAGSLSL